MYISEYDFDVMKVIKEGFRRIEGVKQPFILAFSLYITVAIVTQLVLGIFFPSPPPPAEPNLLNQQIISILSYPILMPIMTGIIMMAVKYAREEPVEVKSIFDYYHIVGHLALASILIYIMTLIGFLLLIIPGIYLSVAYVFTLPIIADKGLGVWEAMELSRKTVTKQWFKIAGVMGILSILSILGFLTLGIGLIWAIPLFFVTLYGLLYPMIFDEVDEEREM
jgi:uncharacterized membrane protein